MPSVDLLPAIRPRRRGLAVAAVVALLASSIAAGFVAVGLDRLEADPAVVIDVATDSPVVDVAVRRDDADLVDEIVSMPIERWLAALAAEAGVGLLLAPGVAGSEVTARFSADLDWRRRLDAVARLYALDVRHENGLLEIAARAPEARIPVSSTMPMPVAVEPGEPRRSTRLLRLSNARASDLVAALDKPLAAAGITAGYDAATNAIVLGGLETELADAVKLARGLDIPRRRFLLEAHIIELSRSARNEMGVQWSLESNDLGAIVDFPSSGGAGEDAGIVVATSGSHSLRARLSALESSGRVRVISRPRIVVVEGKPASIEAVRILRVRLPDQGSVVADSDSNIAVEGGRAFEEIPVGVSLEVEPSLQGEGNIVLRITAKSSTLGPPQPPDGIPEELSRRVEADVVVADGHTAVLGGLLREGRSRSGTGVPLLRSIPVLGALFGRTSQERDIEELVVLVTPRLIP